MTTSGEKIFVADRCRVGFQLRKGTFTGLLAYVIYYGPKGEIRKEKSWKGWCHFPKGDGNEHGSYRDWQLRQYLGVTRDEPIPAEADAEINRVTPREFDNVPTPGFVLNKGVQRFRWHFGSGRSMVRVYDPRGWEFEVTTDNLLNILMHTDCVKREIAGEMVYAWTSRGELMLVPCDSGIYREARAFTDLQAKKVKE